MTCPCGLTWLEFKLWERRDLLHAGDKILRLLPWLLLRSWHLATFPHSDTCLPIKVMDSLHEENKDGPAQPVCWVGLVVKEVEWHLDAWRHCFTEGMSCTLNVGKMMWWKSCLWVHADTLDGKISPGIIFYRCWLNSTQIESIIIYASDWVFRWMSPKLFAKKCCLFQNKKCCVWN